VAISYSSSAIRLIWWRVATGGFLRDSWHMLVLTITGVIYLNFLTSNLTKPWLLLIWIVLRRSPHSIPLWTSWKQSLPDSHLDTTRHEPPLNFNAAATYENICQSYSTQTLSRFPSLAMTQVQLATLPTCKKRFLYWYVQLNLVEKQELFNLLIERNFPPGRNIL